MSFADEILSQGSLPAFAAPWEAQAFAIVVKLHEAGCFTWPEWVETLAKEIDAAKAADEPDLGHAYYRYWLTAAEALVQKKRLVSPSELKLRLLEVEANVRNHIHDASRLPVKIA